MIVLDLEWNHGYDKRPLNEILQIGAVRVDGLGGRILDTFNAYIKPVVHKKFDPGAASLPELWASRRSEQGFREAMTAFRAWCGEETVFAAWGSGDLETLSENCRYWKLPPFSAETVHDFQRAFSRRLETDRQLALWRAAEYCGLPDIFDFHNALNDALYTALIGGWLTPELLVCEPDPPGAVLKLSALPFPPQPRQKVGPFFTPEEVLNAKNSRKPLCPLCGQKGCVLRWYALPVGRDERVRTYFGLFSCPEHGRFPCRLTLSRTEAGLWRGRRTVPVVTPEVERDCAAALRGEVHVCKGNRKRRRRRA